MTGCVRVVYPITIAIKGYQEVDLPCIVHTGAPTSVTVCTLTTNSPARKRSSQRGTQATWAYAVLTKPLTLILVDRKVKGHYGIID
eukprot:CAMPEP_0178928244 /NCGR_PEP_ID=MMETSP0786-20121207/19765_1 /TAXON_ID=186022 /ORGANISM="Thalassionema frauenfeldii, Strain CCMP 1798" /LENGTH=85 /DNA_ID=CAMNT_0020604025 /DNA_START=478 /DNA_END=735 /DNA_ORIENTATION=-